MFRKIAIVGVGLIGGSLGLAVKRRFPETEVIGVSSETSVKNALDIGVITKGFGYSELGKAIDGADIIFLCTPIHTIEGHITQLSGIVKPGVIVTDVGSTKRLITRHAENVLPAGVNFIGGHPMTGSEKSGVNASDPFLFQNAIYVLCPAAGVKENIMSSFSDFLSQLGARVVILDAETHDSITASVSHLPQMLAVALVNMVGGLSAGNAPYLQLAAGGFRDMTRIASSPFSMWDDICRSNGDYIKKAVDEFIVQLGELRNRIGTSGLKSDFESANIIRSGIPKDTKGFLSAMYEALVVVEDKPGVISRISSALSDKDINIKDIEVLKVREGEGGTLRLAFENEKEAHDAVIILNGSGFSALFK